MDVMMEILLNEVNKRHPSLITLPIPMWSENPPCGFDIMINDFAAMSVFIRQGEIGVSMMNKKHKKFNCGDLCNPNYDPSAIVNEIATFISSNIPGLIMLTYNRKYGRSP